MSEPQHDSSESTPEKSYERIKQQIDDLKKIDWGQELVSNAIKVGFRGNFPRAIALLEAMTAGVCDVLSAMLDRGKIPSNYEVPKLVLTDRVNHVATPTELTFDSSDNKYKAKLSSVLISASTLDELSRLDADGMFGIQTPKSKEITSVGKPRELFYQAGIEEAVHTVQLAAGISSNYKHMDGADLGDSKLVEYDAQLMEYQALGWKIKIILDKKKKGELSEDHSNEMLKPLMARLKAAIDHRRQAREKVTI